MLVNHSLHRERKRTLFRIAKRMLNNRNQQMKQVGEEYFCLLLQLLFITYQVTQILYFISAGNNFFLFTGHMSFQIFILVGHLTNWTGHNLLTDNTLKKITQDVLVRCSVVVSDHNVKLAGHFQNLVGQCPMTDCYFQHCFMQLM